VSTERSGGVGSPPSLSGQTLVVSPLAGNTRTAALCPGELHVGSPETGAEMHTQAANLYKMGSNRSVSLTGKGRVHMGLS
jgi:hypothetical protein